MNIERKKRRVCVFLLVLIVAGVVFLTIEYLQKPEEKIEKFSISPPTIPVSSGYIQSYDNELNYGYEYPETWVMINPDKNSSTQDFERKDVLTKLPEGVSITITVKTTSWKSLDEIKKLFNTVFKETIIEEDIIEVNHIQGYEMTQSSPPIYFKKVIFLAGDTMYEFDYSAPEDLFNEFKDTFDHVVHSFNVQ